MAAEGQARSRRKPIVTRVPVGAPRGAREPSGQPAKPTPAELGIDLATLDWQRSGSGSGSFEIAFVAGSLARRPATALGRAAGGHSGLWVLPGRLTLRDACLSERNEWTCPDEQGMVS